MKQFNTKEKVFEHIKKKYSNLHPKGIIIQGSTAKGKIKDFSDIDVVVYSEESHKPDYELCCLNKKLVLITTYFYKAGREINQIPENTVVLEGNCYEQIDIQKDYTKEERGIRDNQMFLDFLFKYLRTKNEGFLDKLDKYKRF